MCLAIVSACSKESIPAAKTEVSVSQVQTASQVQVASQVQMASQPVVSQKSGWEYSEHKDEMRDKTAYLASLKSTNEIDLGFPFGKVSAYIHVGLNEKEDKTAYPDVVSYFTLSDGMVDCSTSEGCNIYVKFDDKKVEDKSVFVLQPADKVLYFGHAYDGNQQAHDAGRNLLSMSFHAQMHMHKRMIVELPIAKYGAAQFKFDIHGLKNLDNHKDWAKQ